MPLTIKPPAVQPGAVSVPLILGSTTIATASVVPPAVTPPAITVADAAMIAALQADGYTVTNSTATSTTSTNTSSPTVTAGQTLPAPTNLPAGPYSVAGTPDVVFAGGVLNWPVDFTYGGLVHSIVADPNGSGAMVLECYTAAGTGGWQPGYQNPPPPYFGTPVLGTTYNTYSTTGKNFLNFDVLVTEENSDFVSGFLAANDSAIAGASTVTIPSSGLTVGQWVRKKIPLGAGGYNLPAGQSVLKFNLQENNPMAGNRFYFNNVFFSAT